MIGNAAERLEQLGFTTAEFYNHIADPFNFVTELYYATGLIRFGVFTDIDEDMIRFAAGGDDIPNRRVLLGPRGIGKSHTCVCAPTAHEQYLSSLSDEKHLTYIPSKSDKVALQNVALIRGWIDNTWFLQHMRPNPLSLHLGGPGHRDSKDQFDVSPHDKGAHPSVRAKGIESQQEGMRAHTTRPDDIEVKGNTRTLTARKWLDKQVREFTEITSYGNRDVVFTGTYNHEESVYLELHKRGFAVRSYPLIAPNDEERDRIIGLAPIIADKLDSGELRPGDKVFTNISDERVADKRAEGKSWFYMQNMLIPSLGDDMRYPLRLQDFMVFTANKDTAPRTISWGKTNDQGRGTRIEDSEIEMHGFEDDGLYRPIKYDERWSPYTHTLMWIDPAGAGDDKLGRAIVSHLNGYLWARLIDGLPGGYRSANLNRIAIDARTYGVNEIIIEDVGLQGMLKPLLEPVVAKYFIEESDARWACSVTTEKGWAASNRGHKEQRIIEALEPVLNQHRIVIDPTVINNADFQYQLTRVTRQRNCLGHEDELEAFAACVWCFREELAIDAAHAAQGQSEEDMDEIIREHMAMAGIPTPEPAWFHDRHRPRRGSQAPGPPIR